MLRVWIALLVLPPFHACYLATPFADARIVIQGEPPFLVEPHRGRADIVALTPLADGGYALSLRCVEGPVCAGRVVASHPSSG